MVQRAIVSLLSACLALGASSAAAQYRQDIWRNVGGFNIIGIADGRAFHRCTAIFPGQEGEVRLTQLRNRTWGISTPPVIVAGGTDPVIRLHAEGVKAFRTTTDGNRTWTDGPLPDDAVNALRRVRGNLVVQTDNRRMVRPLGDVPLVEVMRGIERCVTDHTRNP